MEYEKSFITSGPIRSTDANGMSDIVDSHRERSDPGQDCLFRHVCPNAKNSNGSHNLMLWITFA